MIYFSDLLAWVLVHIGALYFVTESGIASPLRRALTHGLRPANLLVALLYCPGCCGFWLGLLEGALGLTVFGPPTFAGEFELRPWVLQDPYALDVLNGFAGMGLGAWWGAHRPGIAVMFRLEQERETHDHASSVEERTPARREGQPVRSSEESSGSDPAGLAVPAVPPDDELRHDSDPGTRDDGDER